MHEYLYVYLSSTTHIYTNDTYECPPLLFVVEDVPSLPAKLLKPRKVHAADATGVAVTAPLS